MESSKSRNRKAPTEWKYIFTDLARSKLTGFSTQDVRREIAKKNFEMKPNSLQVKLSKYVAKGYLEKIKRDKFKVSELGKVFFEVPEFYAGDEEDYVNY